MALDLYIFASLVHLSKDLDPLTLNFGESAFLDLSLLKSDLLSSMGVTFLAFLFTFN